MDPATADGICYVAQFATGAGYAVLLEAGLKRRYEPDYTWATVVGGTALVGLIVAARLVLAPLPALAADALAWWGWWLWTYSFAASGLPIVFWQLVVQRGRVVQLRDYLISKRGNL